MAAGAVVLAAGAGALWFLKPAPQPAEPPPVNRPATPPPSTSAPAPRPSEAPPKPATPPPVEPATTAPTTGTLVITSDAPDTSVFIDRKYLGTAPVTATGLTPGSHHLNMSATGYDGISEDIDVAAGSHEIAKSFKTVKLDASLAVVHKHAFGSCKGTLRATPAGIVYDTTNKDDKFSVALTDLETFEVDYVAKTMTIKIRKGKTFKLTDPEDNADRLFVFHRDVDKVRKKVGGG